LIQLVLVLTPGRVFKGTRMGGRMGSENKTIKNKKVVDINDTIC
jgi:large subunit ribosomal protein L3